MNLSSGTVTFLFTDIEGSTRLWEDRPDAMGVYLARHDSLLRAAIEANSGTVFKTVGDAFCAVFPTAIDAMQAALSAQQAIHRLQPSTAETPALTLEVRMALHTGTAEMRDGDYFGPAMNRVARLLAAGHGGQVLLSEASAALVRDCLPDGVSLKDLGAHQLRDIARPEQVYQVTHPDLPSSFPPLRSLHPLAHNLPVQLTTFIGREKETRDVRRLLEATRLLTLTGSGGAGKTRLSLQVAAEELERFPDGVWLVELAPLTEGDHVPGAVASVLRVREEGNRPLIETLIEWLAPRNLLLVLDNCEHLLPDCADLACRALQACPQVRILASSREGLGIAGETTYLVGSLPLPDPAELPPASSMWQYAAVALFIERASAAVPQFTVTADNAPAIAQICCRLDGIPLAIELAAARVRALPVDQIARRLDDSFRLLTGGSRTALPRQQTLQALIDWSYNLLSEPERTLLARLSVYSGGWTAEAAEAVCAGDGIDEWEVIDLVTQLVDKSLVVYEEQHNPPRDRFLETIRQYARDRLAASGGEEIIRRRHTEYFTRIAEEAEGELWGGEQQVARLDQLQSEHANFRGVLEWLRTSGADAESWLRLAAALGRFWLLRGYFTEGCQRLQEALTGAAGASDALRAKALYRLCFLLLFIGDYNRVLELGQEALLLYRELEDLAGIAFMQGLPGLVAFQRGDYEQARSVMDENLPLARRAGDQWVIGGTLTLLGILANDQGDHERARALLEEGLSVCQQGRDRWQIAFAMIGLGKLELSTDHLKSAKAYFAEGLQLSAAVGDRRRIAQSLEGVAEVAARLEQFERAARLFGAAEALREVIHSPLPRIESDEYAPSLATSRAAIGDEAFHRAWDDGRSHSLERTMQVALEEP